MTRLPPANVTLYYIRHGQTNWNREGRMQGQIDQPLNDTGRAQAARNGGALKAALGDRAEQFDFVCSPLQRTRETMEIARRTMQLDPPAYRLDKRLLEISFGDWEGKTMPEINAYDPDGHAARNADKWGWAPPGGESYEMLFERVGDWLADVQRDSVIVSHGGIMRVLRKHLEELDPQIVPHMKAPQDKVMVYRDGIISWI